MPERVKPGGRSPFVNPVLLIGESHRRETGLKAAPDEIQLYESFVRVREKKYELTIC